VIPGDPSGGVMSTPLYFPSAGWITHITRNNVWYSVPPAGPTPDVVEYSLHYAPCREVALRFGHVASLSPAVNAALTAAVAGGGGTCESYDTDGHSFENCRYSMKVAVTSGAQVGTVGGTPDVFAWDLWAYDARRTPIVYANPTRYSAHPSGIDSFHVVCPIDYFEPVKKSVLETFLGDGTTARTAPPICGTIEQDVTGSAQGNWFFPGTSTYPEDPHLALVHDNVLPNLGVFSVGNSVTTLPSGYYQFTPVASGQVNRDFQMVTPGLIYCYENLRNHRYAPAAIPNTVILTQLTSPTMLSIEKRTVANCAALGPEATWSMSLVATAFER
jgi:hypothetical protein